MLTLDYIFVFLTFISLISLILLIPLALFKKVKIKAPLIALGSLLICFTLTGLIANLGLKHRETSNTAKNYSARVGNYTIYKTKISKITDNGNGNWKISGKTNAPDNSKIIATVSNKNNINYGEISAESIKLASWAKAKGKKFTVIVDSVGITNAEKPKAGNTTKTLIFAIKNYDKSWDKSQVSSKIVKKANKFGSVNLTITKKQSKYLAGIKSGLNDSSSSIGSYSSSSNSIESIVKFESELNEAIENSKGTIIDIKYSANSDGSSIDTVNIVTNDFVSLASSNDQQKVADSALNTVSELSTVNGIKTPSVVVTTEGGTQIASSSSDNTTMILSSN